MQEKDLKPSKKQRLIFALVAFVLLGSSLAAYVLIVMGNGTVNYSKMTMDQLQTAYSDKLAEIETVSSRLSEQYFEEFKSYKKNVKAYNSTTANSNGVQSKDLKEGDGDTVNKNNYNAYYIGYCSNEDIFDSSFDNYDEPTSLKSPLDLSSVSLIEGWYLGAEGMKFGGVREITIPGSLAYGETTEICGDTNSPLKFIIMAIPQDAELTKLNTELSKIETALYAAYTQAYSSSTSASTSTEETSGE